MASADSLLLAAPVGWTNGLVELSAAPALPALPAAGATCVGLWQLPETAEGMDSELGLLWSRYRKLSSLPLSPSEAVKALRLERLLQGRFAPGCLEPARLRQPWPLGSWLGDLAEDPDTLAAELLDLLHLLPSPEQEPLAEDLTERIAAGLRTEQGDKNERGPWLRLLDALVGGLNSSTPLLRGMACGLRSLGLRHASELEDPAARGIALVGLLQGKPAASPKELGSLVEAIDDLVLASGIARDAADQVAQRRLNGALETIVRKGGSELLLLRSLVLALNPDTCHRLGSLKPASVLLPLLQAVLLLDSTQAACLEDNGRRALVNLVERILPRVWWQQTLLVELLQGLRRCELELSWLWEVSVLLKGLERLHSRGIAPLSRDGETATWLEPQHPDQQLLLRTQVLVLLRLLPHPCDQAGGLLRLAGSAGKPPLLRLLDREDEEALVMAATAGLASRSVLLSRLAAERSGVPELLPPLLPVGDLEQAFSRILEHWHSRFSTQAGSAQAPITVVISAHAPQLNLLSLALESLSLQTLWPREVWVVDDASPPGIAADLADLVATCRRRLRLPLRLLRRSAREGTCRCRNVALEVMSGQALALQNVEALSHPLRLALQWQELKRGRAAVYARHLRLHQATAAPLPDGDGGGFFGDGITTLMVKRSIARDLGGFQGGRNWGDLHLWRQLEQCGGSCATTLLEQPLVLMSARHWLCNSVAPTR
ncbi:glycosyltransferase [Cyanobium sp. ATX 6A2]|uniref:glycosyltransferase n=1 Tax=Cyanobium sp. ATX 6A2 TaxID=2823700 RepID=UPI0020CC0B5C|nr:glycosyltransferase [Cyanobium sp. ATX 6A2]